MGAVSLVDVRAWRPGALDSIAERMGTHGSTLRSLQDELSASRPPMDWVGEAAEAARGRHRRREEQIERIVAEAAATETGVLQAAERVRQLHHAIAEAEERARSEGFSVAPNGRVDDVAPPEDVAEEDVAAVKARREAASAEVVDRIYEVLRAADDVSSDLAGVLAKAADGAVDVGAGVTSVQGAAIAGHAAGELSVVAPPVKGSPTENAGWWQTLTASERKSVIATHPEWVGNRAGVPAEARNEANRNRLPQLRNRLQDKITQLQNHLAEQPHGPGFDTAHHDERQRLERMRTKLASLNQVDDVIGLDNRHLLSLDTSGQRVTAAITNGNIDTAKHVAVMTPGFTSTVHGSMKGYDRKMEGLQDQAQRQSRRFGDGGEVATVTWIGYEAPQWDEVGDLGGDSVLSEESARTGGKKLADELAGINASRETDPHLTAVGHSYGTLTTEHALQQPTGVDDVVLYGSPGMPPNLAEGMQVPEGHTYALEAENDPIATSPYFGPDPDSPSLERHTGREVHDLSADQGTSPDGRELQASHGHSEYLVNDTTSQWNIAGVVSDVDDRTIPDDNSDEHPIYPPEDAH